MADGTWLVCAQHPEDTGCWVILSEKNWPDLAGRRALWCYTGKHPVAIERDDMGQPGQPDYSLVRQHLRSALEEMGSEAEDGEGQGDAGAVNDGS